YVREVGWFALRTGLVIGVAGLTILLIAAAYWPGPDSEHVKMQRTLLLSTLILLGVTALLRVLTDGETQPLVGDTKFRWLAIAAVPVYLTAMYWPLAADILQLVPLGLREWGLVLAVVAPAFAVCKLTDGLRFVVRASARSAASPTD